MASIIIFLLLFLLIIFSDSIRFVGSHEMAAATLHTLCTFWIVRASKSRSASMTYDKTCLWNRSKLRDWMSDMDCFNPDEINQDFRMNLCAFACNFVSLSLSLSLSLDIFMPWTLNITQLSEILACDATRWINQNCRNDN